MLNFAFCKRHALFASADDTGAVTITHRDALTLPQILELQRHFGAIDHIEQMEAEAFEPALQQHFASSDNGALGDIHESLGTDTDLASLLQNMDEPEDLLESEDDAPIIRLLNALFSEAIRQNASDIHIESYEARVRIRFRIDGVLKEVMEPQRNMAPLLISRVKVMAKLNIAEKRIPQDGRIALRLGGRSVDLRVSTLPSAQGERVVLRLLDKQAGRLSLDTLGMPENNRAIIDRAIASPHGIVLVTGPTGSGKTTTLYAALEQLNNHERNIMTVEDPIEYHIDGINQTQINAKVDMTFARGLKAILRQDPDVVMVGEIRDMETAEIAVQASLTGHLVLSTLHTNTAIGALTRLRDMGIQSFLLSSSLLAVVAQRLVRKLCDCAEPYEASDAERYQLGLPVGEDDEGREPLTLYRAKGCDKCNHTGYKGRIGIYEVLLMDETARQMVHDNASESEMLTHLRKQHPSLLAESVALLRAGKTTFEEVVRVVHNA